MEFLGRETIEVCRGCREVLARNYWRVDGDVVCGACAEERRREADAEEREDLWRGMRFGVIAAVATALLQAGAWALIAMIDIGEQSYNLRTYLETPVALLGGVVVGTAVRAGSERYGGWPLQVMAVALAYLAFAVSVPLGTGSSGAALALRVVVAPVTDLGRNPAGGPRMVDALFGMGLAWQMNRIGRRLAVSGPFEYVGRGGSAPKRRMSH